MTGCDLSCSTLQLLNNFTEAELIRTGVLYKSLFFFAYGYKIAIQAIKNAEEVWTGLRRLLSEFAQMIKAFFRTFSTNSNSNRTRFRTTRITTPKGLELKKIPPR
jgi:hypothetical protein